MKKWNIVDSRTFGLEPECLYVMRCLWYEGFNTWWVEALDIGFLTKPHVVTSATNDQVSSFLTEPAQDGGEEWSDFSEARKTCGIMPFLRWRFNEAP
ncbi:hypothetical protein L484_013132 [Morus notabilis]|uniref:Uncharacterized protein n=1 Tax=Morus notabilis TaxID=981085 RepID=W9RM51_9ROSA|nr:hypothetical protein L484_013132 [Morus notabilis]